MSDELPTEYWYRYYDHSQSSWDEYGERVVPGSTRAVVVLQECRVARHTRRGVWLAGLGTGVHRDLWVSDYSRKRYAYPTKELAWESFKARKRMQRAIIEARLRHVEACLRICDEEMPEESAMTYHVDVNFLGSSMPKPPSPQ